MVDRNRSPLKSVLQGDPFFEGAALQDTVQVNQLKSAIEAAKIAKIAGRTIDDSLTNAILSLAFGIVAVFPACDSGNSGQPNDLTNDTTADVDNELGICVECRTNEDCRAGTVCSTAWFFGCPKELSVDGWVGPAYLISNSFCADSSQCGTTQRCGIETPSAGLCLKGCSTDGDCFTPDGERCYRGACLRNHCGDDDSSCPLECDPLGLNVCVGTCSGSEECRSNGEVCVF